MNNVKKSIGWVGATATSDGALTIALTNLGHIEASVKYISFEPLLGAIQPPIGRRLRQAGINWIIIGQQTPYNPKTAPKIEWLKEIVEAADKVGIPVFLKDNLKPLIQESGFSKANWAAKEWVQCKYPILRQEMPRAQ